MEQCYSDSFITISCRIVSINGFIESYLDVIKKLKELVLQSGKKCHVLAMGKPSPAKLGNYLDISVFCLVSCPENSIFDSREFHVPVVTPYELMLALGSGLEWNGSYESDLNVLSRKLVQVLQDSKENGQSLQEEDEPYFSLVTGGYKQKSISNMSNLNPHTNTNEQTLQSRLDSGSLERFTDKGTAMSFFKSRSFQGLEVKKGETLVVEVAQGRTGIASDYGFTEE